MQDKSANLHQSWPGGVCSNFRQPIRHHQANSAGLVDSCVTWQSITLFVHNFIVRSAALEPLTGQDKKVKARHTQATARCGAIPSIDNSSSYKELTCPFSNTPVATVATSLKRLFAQAPSRNAQNATQWRLKNSFQCSPPRARQLALRPCLPARAVLARIRAGRVPAGSTEPSHGDGPHAMSQRQSFGRASTSPLLLAGSSARHAAPSPSYPQRPA